ncbi:hypothetical protein Pcinc_010252 [Petrolisthes cinctipes]|uniref:Uncharacterized protein n=1 Tax=Petrolisthes cinctipes TaxID=88211 RepID=A0AAE1G5P3_PETCI|nr:hypothetical protein Pcinc_010252 [Petrolisthes cinctipes]
MKALDINTNSWEDLAADRTSWRSTLHKQLLNGEEKLSAVAAEKRARRKATTTNRPDSTHRCDHECHSRIGLHSHKRDGAGQGPPFGGSKPVCQGEQDDLLVDSVCKQAPFCYVHVSFLVSGGESELGYGKVPPPARPWPWLRPRSRSSQGQDKGHGWGGGDERGHQTPPVNTPRNWRLTSPVVWGHRGSCLDARYTALAASVYAIVSA